MIINLLIPAIFLYIIIKYFTVNRKINLIKFLFTYIFIFGILELSGIPEIIIKASIDLLFLLILFYLFRIRSFRTFGLGLFIIFTVCIIFSIVINNSNIYHSLTFYRIYLYPYIVFLFFINIRISDKKWRDLNRLIIFLFILQIVASVYKFFFIGIVEKELVGTISTSGGVYSTTLPLFAISFLVSFYLLYKRKSKYILLIIGFLFMGFVGSKRGIWFYTPVLLLVAWYLYIKTTKLQISNRRNLSMFVLLIILALGAVVFGGKYNRTLNPDNQLGGGFDPEYIRDYAIEYTFSGSQVGAGRGTNFIRTIDNMKKAPLPNLLFGYGPDAVKGNSTYGEGIWGEFGISGPVTGFTANLVQVGLFGSILIIVVFIILFRLFFRSAKQEQTPYWKAIALGGATSMVMTIIDYFTYSVSFFNTIFPLSFSLLYVLGMLESRKRFGNISYTNKRLILV